jgi:sortase A
MPTIGSARRPRELDIRPDATAVDCAEVRRGRKRGRAATRFAAWLLIASGALALADAALTLAWQEPLSGLAAARAQHRLERELHAVPHSAARSGRRSPRAVRRLAGRANARARRGAALGRLELPRLGRSFVMVEGTDPASLRSGPGHYEDTSLPGEGGTVAVAGHRTTYLAPFRDLDELRPGDRIVAAMPYGRLVYEVERTRVLPAGALWVKRPAGHERLVLTACHPLYSAAQRIVVFARLATA